MTQNGEIDLRKTCDLIIKNKYFETFNFYFSKPTNEVLVNIEAPHVIQFKDYLYYDDINEFLKRPYKTGEAKDKMAGLIEYYTSEANPNLPSLAQVDQGKIIMKRYMRLLHPHYKSEASYSNGEGPPSSYRPRKEVNEEQSVSNAILTSKFQEQLRNSNFAEQMNSEYGGDSFETDEFDIWAPESEASFTSPWGSFDLRGKDNSRPTSKLLNFEDKSA